MYRKEYYQQNKEKFLEWQRIYRKKNHEKVLKNRRIYDEINRDKHIKQKKNWILNNKERYKRQKAKDDKKYYEKMKTDKLFLEKKHRRERRYREKNKDKIKSNQKIYSEKPEVKARRKELERIRRRLNPQSNRSLPLEEQAVMNMARLRDKNTCKWGGCGLKYPEVTIEVNHILPRSKHPELRCELRNMICYCVNHHIKYHQMRGELQSAQAIRARYLRVDLDGKQSLEGNN